VAIGATVARLEVSLSDVDRGVYESLSLRVAQHPSETRRYLMARILAYCLSYEEGIAFGRGVSTSEEPAVWAKDLTGAIRLWIEVGNPSAERLHRASKAADRVVVFTHKDPEAIVREAEKKGVHRAETIPVFALDPAFLDRLDEATARSGTWELVRNQGVLYVTVADQLIEGHLQERKLTGGREIQGPG